MVVQCLKCKKWFEDCYRSTICPHNAFPANDGNNNFEFHYGSWLSDTPPGDMPLGQYSLEVQDK